jgi:hypothetical protein
MKLMSGSMTYTRSSYVVDSGTLADQSGKKKTNSVVDVLGGVGAINVS